MKFMKKPEKGISVWPILLLLAVLGLLAILARFSYTDYVRPASDKMLVEVNQTDHTDKFLDFYLTNPVTDASGKEYYVEITSLDGTTDNAIGIFTAGTDPYPDGALYENGRESTTDLCFRIYGQPAKMVLKIFYLFLALLFVTVIVSFFLLYLRPLKLEYLFLVMAVLLGGLYLILFPPLSAPDDYRHFETSYYYSSRMLGQQGVDDDGNVLVREEDYRAF